MDTYDKRCQLAASRRQLEDAQVLHTQKRWLGSIYLGGYAIECSLKALICYEEGEENFKDTKIFKKGLRGSELHNLTKLLNHSTLVQRAISLDRTQVYQNAWNTVSCLWRNAELRYSQDLGAETDSKKFIEAVEKLHKLFLQKQGVK
ncbi:hypothetical protein [Nostoc sp. LEGE 12450]|uniref:hypothetical protein n=1 Tax=Nostoc sp. LEGE 12450 TaxID=1828643 RepID=UPI00187EF7F2|nr:hypothetical protein [Nostoc sp. LEGE 12450]MBE8989073.1 hypothetical protein [Nostoc sp. LEGE 12450]